MTRRLTRRDWLALSSVAAGASLLSGCASGPVSPAPSADVASDAPLKDLAAAKGIRFGSAMAARQLQDERYKEIILRECATIVAENEHKWYSINPAPDVWNWKPGDDLVAFAKANDLKMRGHTLLWHKTRWSPQWVNEKEFASAAETEAFVANYVSQVARRHDPFLYAWDVVNEAVHDQTGDFRTSSLTKHMGENLIDFCFALAREHAPNAKLVYNDYMSWEDSSAPHREGVLRFLERLLKRGVPVEGLGIQSHSNYEMPDEYTREKQRNWIAFVDEVVGMGLEIYITEYDVNDTRMGPDIAYRDRVMASYTRDYFDLMLSYPQLKEILIWGMVDDQNWLQTFLPREDDVLKRPTLYDENYQAKSMRTALAEALIAAPQRPPMA
ncbi:MAG: endo-1,4-beta-xylanase [Hyphomonadaceae bacterium]|nr:endo-1,4-beta-xylanase [Hyphomonadaceae bacterium]